MIVFELICAARHRFEGWFASGEDFNAQQSRRLIACPQCGTDSVEKLPTARIGKSHPEPQPAKATPAKVPAKKPANLNELIDHILLNTEDVGPRFAEEARRTHRQEAPVRDIRGTATGEEAKQLLEEGVPVLPLPIPPQGEWH
jgi:hypothetical protein